MTEADWLASTDPGAMLDFLTNPAWTGRQHNSQSSDRWLNNPRRPSDRKLRLFACACCWQLWAKLTDWRSRLAVETAEKFTDGEIQYPELLTTHINAHQVPGAQIPSVSMAAAECLHNDADAAAKRVLQCTQTAYGTLSATHVALLHDLIGNPFYPVVLPTVRVDVPVWDDGPAGWRDECPWLTTLVSDLALAAYTERPGRECKHCRSTGKIFTGWDGDQTECLSCHGTGIIEDGALDNTRLAVLSDALEEAGCPVTVCCPPAVVWAEVNTVGNAHALLDRHKTRTLEEAVGKEAAARVSPHPLLAHLRSPGPHYRGMWSLDLLLGKG